MAREPLGSEGPQPGSSLGAEPSDRPPVPPPSADGSGVDSLRPSEELLTSFLGAVRRKDDEEQARLRRLRPDQSETFDAIVRAWEHLAPLLQRREGVISLATAGDEVDPGISLHPRPSDANLDQGLIERIAKNCVPIERYQRPREIARGGMGSIQRVWDSDLRRYLVMKVMLQPGDRDPSASGRPPDSRQLTRFLEEAQITGQLDHPAIVPVHDLGLDQDGRLYFTMPLVKGQDLGAVIRDLRKGEGDWTVGRLVSALLKAMEAVSFAHNRGVIHRDLKPENIMVGRFGEVYVMDWGLARVLTGDERDVAESLGKPKTTIELLQQRRKRRQAARELEPQTVRTDRSDDSRGRTSSVATLDGDMIGTPGYMSPEQARGERREIGPRADVWSMGAVLYQVLTGYMPYNDPQSRSTTTSLIERVLNDRPVPVSKLAPPETPQELVAICEKAMAWEPDQRYGTMVEMTADVQAFLEGRVVSAYDTSALAQVRTWIKRNQLAAGLIATILLGTLLGAGLMFVQQERNLVRLSEEQAKLEEEKVRADEQAELAREQAALAKTKEAEALAEREKAEAERDNANYLLGRLTDQITERQREQDRMAFASTVAKVSNYRSQILLAELSLANGLIGEAKRLLASSDPERRGWEWSHLIYRVDGALAVGLGHGAGVSAAAVDGRGNIATLGTDGTVRTWDPDTGDQLESWSLPSGSAVSMAYGPLVGHPLRNGFLARSNDGSVVALAAGSSRVEPARYLQREDASPGAFAYIAGDLLALAVEDAQGSYLALIDETDGAVVRDVALEGPVEDMVADPRGRFLAVAGRRGTLELYDLGDPQRPLRLWRQRIDGSFPRRIAFGPYGDQLAILAEAGRVVLYEAESGALIGDASYAESLTAVCYGSRASRLFLGTANGTLIVADARTGEAFTRLNGHEDAITDLVCDDVAGRLVSTSNDRTVRLWSTTSDAPSRGFRTSLRPGRAALVPSPEEGVLLLTTGSQVQAVDTQMLGVSDFRRLSPLPEEGVSSTRDGEWLLGVVRGRPTLWPHDGEDSLAEGPDLELDGWSVTAFGASRNGRVLAFALAREAQRLVRQPLELVLFRPTAAGEFGAPIRVALEPGFPLEFLALDARGERVYAAERSSGFVRRFDAAQGREEQALRTVDQELMRGATVGRRLCAELILAASNARNVGPLPVLPVEAESDRSVSAMVVSESGQLALGLRNGTVLLWQELRDWDVDVDPFELESKPVELIGHEGPVHALAFFPRDERLVSGSRDATLRLWEPEYTEALAVLREHETSVRSVLVLDEGARIASLDAQGRVVFWETEPTDVQRTSTDATRRGLQASLDRLREYYDSLLSPLAQVGQGGATDLTANWTRTHLEAWAVLRDGDRSEVVYQDALDKARAAAKQLEGVSYERTLCFGYLRNGQWSQARRGLERLRSLHADRGDLLAGLVLACVELDDRAAAVGYWSLLQDQRESSEFARRDRTLEELSDQARDALAARDWL
jgi:serine/threonine protein kinase/WD40 repeat protein